MKSKPFLDPRKQKLARLHNETLASVCDDFDYLTTQVRKKKLEEYVQKREEEIKRTQANDKTKNQSTAYRPTNIPVPKPHQKVEETPTTPLEKNLDSELEESVKAESPVKEEAEIPKSDEEMAKDSEASEEEATGTQMIDSNVT